MRKSVRVFAGSGHNCITSFQITMEFNHGTKVFQNITKCSSVTNTTAYSSSLGTRIISRRHFVIIHQHHTMWLWVGVLCLSAFQCRQLRLHTLIKSKYVLALVVIYIQLGEQWVPFWGNAAFNHKNKIIENKTRHAIQLQSILIFQLHSWASLRSLSLCLLLANPFCTLNHNFSFFATLSETFMNHCMCVCFLQASFFSDLFLLIFVCHFLLFVYFRSIQFNLLFITFGFSSSFYLLLLPLLLLVWMKPCSSIGET